MDEIGLVETHTEYLDSVVSVPLVVESEDTLGFVPSLRFGSFAGIEDFGTSITLPGESSVTEPVVSGNRLVWCEKQTKTRIVSWR